MTSRNTTSACFQACDLKKRHPFFNSKISRAWCQCSDEFDQPLLGLDTGKLSDYLPFQEGFYGWDRADTITDGEILIPIHIHLCQPERSLSFISQFLKQGA